MIAAGPVTNILVAFLIFMVVYATGAPTGNATTRVGEVERNTPAAAAGLQAGDRVVAVNGTKTGDVRARLEADPLEPRQADHGHGASRRLDRHARAAGHEALARRPLDLGLRPGDASASRTRSVTARASPRTTAGRSPPEPRTRSARVFHKKERGQLTSAVGIVRVSQQALKVGFSYYLQIVGLVSMSLALLNLLPFLPLDGGHILFSLIERVRRRAVAREVYERVSVVGFGLILLLTFIALSNDLGGTTPR